MAEVYCGSEPCPLFLNSTCVFYTGESLLYIGVQNNDTLETIIVKINQAFQNAGVGYAFTNGLIQPTPFQPVQLGGALTQNTTIGGNFTLSFSGNVQAAKHITTGGSSSQFVKGDGTLDSTAYQPAANYITGLSGDATASGPGVAVMTLNTVNFSSGTFGNGNTIPIVTVNAKGLVTNITPVPITLPPLPLTFIGDVVGSGFTGSSITLLMQNVNANPYNTITPLKFSVNGKGLVTGASPITASDIVNILGYYPGTSGTSGSDGTSGTSGTTGTSGTSGTSATSGTSGTTGTSGTSATSGTSGTSGTDGTGGTSGTSGSTGTSGTSGTSGTAGTSGTSGTTGTSGSSGTSGSTGTSGSSGTTGTSGSSGTTGTSGSSGTSGTTGTSGSSGTSGTTGLDGTNGTSGTSGTTGTSGSSGTSGTSATSGSSGTSGSTGTSGTSGLSGDRFKTTSTTTYTLQAPGNPGTLTVDPGLAYTVGQSIIIAYDANNHNEAEVTSYDAITGVINFVTFTLTGSGTYSSWFVNIDGASGGDGSSGTSGTAGTSGSSGTSGTTGTSGSSGTSGTSATDGTSGSSGTSAIDGTSGTSGTSGTTGTSGSSGTSGTTGTSGSSGTSGTSATNGTGGTSGTSGSSGTSGTTGTSGTSATSGTSGTSATSGTTGTSGTSGVSGTGGSSGTSGTSATSGTSGTSGATGASGTSGTSGTSVAVSGTTNTMAKFTSATTIGNSLLTDDGSTLSYVNNAQFLNGKTYTLNNGSGTSFEWYVRPDNNTTYVWRHIYGGSGTGFGTGVGGYGIYPQHLGGDYSAIFNTAGFVTFPYSARSPIFYDSQDTTYYLDPNSTGLSLSSNGIVSSGGGTAGGFQNRIFVAGRNRIWSFGNADAYGISYFQGPDFIGLHFGTATQAASQFWVSDSGISQTSASSRAPIFYDSNNTGFYFDGASTSVLNALNVNSILVNNSVNIQTFNTRNLIVKSTGAGDAGILGRGSSDQFAFQVYGSGGDYGFLNGAWAAWDIRKTANGSLFLNDQTTWYISTSEVYMNRVYGITDMRSPIYYDQNDTGYFGDFNGISSLWGIAIRGDNGPTSTTNQIFFWGGGNTTTSAIGFKANGGSFTNPTGSGDGYNTYLTMDTPGRGWVFREGVGGTNFNSAYTSGWILNNGIWQANSSMRAPIFYDSNNTNYYVDAGGNSRISSMTTDAGTAIYIGNQNVSTSSRLIINWHTDSDYQYLIGKRAGAWTQPMDIAFYTGLRYHAHNAYGGHRFYTTGFDGVQAMSIGDGDNHVRVLQNLYARNLIDLDNSAYYVDPNGGTSLYGTFQVSGAHSDSQIGVRLLASNNGAGNGEVNLRMWCSEPGVTWTWAGFGYNVTNNGGSPSGFGRINTNFGQAYMRFSDGGDLYFYNTNTSGTRSQALHLNSAGVANFGAAVNSPSGYVSNGNPWGTSNSAFFPNGISTAGSTNWIYGLTYIGNAPGNGAGHEFYTSGSSYSTGNMEANGSMRAPIFYDRNNTSYYIDAASTSVLHTLLNIGGWLEVRSNVYATNPTTESGLFFGWNKSGGTGEANIIVDGGANTGQFLFQRYNGGGSYTNIFQADIYGLTANSGTVNVFSDIRLKTNITNATPKLDDLMKLNVVNYEFVGEYDVLGKQLGFIAQEVEQIFPSLVREQDTRQYDEQGNYIKGYEDTKILKVGMEFAMLVKAMQEQQSIIDSLKSEIETLKQK